MAERRSTLDGLIIAVVVAIAIVLLIIGLDSNRNEESSPESWSPQEQRSYQSDNSSDSKATSFDTTARSLNSEPSPHVSIKQMNAVKSAFLTDNETVEDIWGNTYNDYVVATIWTMGDSEDRVWEDYAISGSFKQFTGTLFMSKDSPEVEQYQVRVYADSNEVYASPIVDKRSKPEQVFVNIPDGTDFLRIEFQMIQGSTSALSGWYPWCKAYLASGTFHR